ncbi:MAG: T9SS type A sorting domain-containing protein [Bacteroidetes bacterium]|nr:T9SS type A sorting domain-containing protein [Bacteroidota bacterium]
MKTITLSLFMILAGCELRAQFYQITFAGTGASSTVDSVKVENLSQCTSLLLGGTDTLILDREVGIKETGNPREYTMNLYPNPCPGTCSVEFQVPSAGDISIRLYGISGETILHEKEFLQKGEHRFQLSGIEAGVYIVKIETDRHIYSAKLISKAAGAGSPAFTAMEPAVMKMMQPDVNGTTDPGQFRGTRSIVLMQFNAGDTLKLTGKSGNYRTVSMLFPTHNQTVTFSFVNCTDADSNHYAVVRIGSQLWMQENLKTTRYLDGSAIPNVPDSATWGSLTTGAYCDFHNLPAEGEFYGRLYNFYAVDDSRKMCPWEVQAGSSEGS